jgi:hypothetical protein
MSKLTELAAEYAARKKGPLCSVQRFLATIPEKDRQDVVDAIASDVISTALSEALVQVYGVKLNSHIISRHRRGECMCRS